MSVEKACMGTSMNECKEGLYRDFYERVLRGFVWRFL